jgi:hypothetical protein
MKGAIIMESMNKKELEELLKEVITIYRKKVYSTSHEYFTEPDAEKKIFTVADDKRMNEIIKKLGM